MLPAKIIQSIFASFDLPERNLLALANEALRFRYCTIVLVRKIAFVCCCVEICKAVAIFVYYKCNFVHDLFISLIYS